MAYEVVKLSAEENQSDATCFGWIWKQEKSLDGVAIKDVFCRIMK